MPPLARDQEIRHPTGNARGFDPRDLRVIPLRWRVLPSWLPAAMASFASSVADEGLAYTVDIVDGDTAFAVTAIGRGC